MNIDRNATISIALATSVIGMAACGAWAASAFFAEQTQSRKAFDARTTALENLVSTIAGRMDVQDRRIDALVAERSEIALRMKLSNPEFQIPDPRDPSKFLPGAPRAGAAR